MYIGFYKSCCVFFQPDLLCNYVTISECSESTLRNGVGWGGDIENGILEVILKSCLEEDKLDRGKSRVLQKTIQWPGRWELPLYCCTNLISLSPLRRRWLCAMLVVGWLRWDRCVSRRLGTQEMSTRRTCWCLKKLDYNLWLPTILSSPGRWIWSGWVFDTMQSVM